MANEQSKLSNLPSDVWHKILKEIANDELLQLRLVDSFLNQMVLQRLGGIDFLQFIDSRSFDHDFRNLISYKHPDALVDNFEFKKFVVPLKGSHDDHGPVISRAVSFFHRICTLKALEFPNAVKLSQIRDVAPNLLYIKAESIENDCGLEDDEIVNLFHSLEVLDISLPEKPFCQNSWSQKGKSLIQWSNKCCGPDCRKIGPPESARFLQFVSVYSDDDDDDDNDADQVKPMTIADLDWLKDWCSVRVLRVENATPPCRLFLPELKCFDLVLSEEKMQLSMLTNYIHHSEGLKHLTLYAAGYVDYYDTYLPLLDHETCLSLLRFIGSLSNLTSLNLTLRVEEATEEVTDDQPKLSKNKLEMVKITFYSKLDFPQFKLICSITDSSDVLMDFQLQAGGSTLRFERAKNILYFNGPKLPLFLLYLPVLSHQRQMIKRLYLASKDRDGDADRLRDQVVAVLALGNLEEFNFMVSDQFLATWLTLFTKLKDRRAPRLSWTNGLMGVHNLSEKTRSLVAQAVEDGKISKFTHSSNPSLNDLMRQCTVAMFEDRDELEKIKLLFS